MVKLLIQLTILNALHAKMSIMSIARIAIQQNALNAIIIFMFQIQIVFLLVLMALLKI